MDLNGDRIMSALKEGGALTIDIRRLTRGDERLLEQAPSGIFDHAVDRLASAEFLADPRHHIIAAIDNGVLIGFISAVHYVHPDASWPELWLNEVSASESHRGRGIGKAMMKNVLELARDLRCRETRVLADSSNERAHRLYRSAADSAHADPVIMYTFNSEAEAGTGNIKK